MRYIRNISDDQNKSGDTDNIFRFNLLQGDDVFNFGDYPISINIANSSGYILSMVPEKEFGNSVLKLDFNDQSLKSLTPDNYLLEVEVKFPDGTTATFPTKGGMPFSINSNLKNTAGHLVPIVTFDEVLSAVDKKVNNYLATVTKGDKGDPGEKGDTGVVDTAKDYTWTGTNTFNKQIIAPAGVQGNADTADVLNIRPATFTDISVVTADMITYAGNWSIFTPDIKGMPNIGFGVMEVLPYQGNKTAGIIKISSTNIVASNYIGTVEDGSQLFWVLLPDDSTLVHNTGTETVAGDKTFTGNVSFTKQIDGSTSTKQIPVNDFRDIALNTIKYSGHWFANSVIMDNSPLPGQALYGGIEVIAGYNQFAGIIVYSDYPSWRQAGTYVASIEGSIINWVKISNDATVVHNTGTETIAGDKTFTGNNTFTGKTSFWFKQIQWNSGIMQGTWYIQRMGNWVNAKFDMSANTGTGTTTLTLPVGYRPLSQFVRDLEQGGAGISQNGTVLLANSYTGSNAMTFSYPTNDVWPTA